MASEVRTTRGCVGRRGLLRISRQVNGVKRSRERAKDACTSRLFRQGIVYAASSRTNLQSASHRLSHVGDIARDGFVVVSARHHRQRETLVATRSRIGPSSRDIAGLKVSRLRSHELARPPAEKVE